MRLIDGNALKDKMSNYHLQVDGYRHDNKIDIMTKVAQAMHDNAIKCISDSPTIDPETMPIVRELREKLERVTAQRNGLFELLNDVCKDVRETHVDDSVCGLCEYDGAHISEIGDWACECPGFDSDDCFCMKKSLRKKYGQEY